MDEFQIKRQIEDDVRSECLALALLLFDRAEDGSHKPEHMSAAREALNNYDENSDSVWLGFFACRIATLASMADDENINAFYGDHPSIVMGAWAGIMVSAAMRDEEMRRMN